MNTNTCFSRLTLFDIDGTLIRSSTGHDEAFSEGFRTVYDIDTGIKVIKHSGMTDQQIIFEVLRYHGLSDEEIMPKIDACMEVMVDYFEKHKDSMQVEVLPGIPELLAKLERRGALIGHVTGNLEPIAMGKMEKADLRDFFRLGGYGSDDISRARLVELAVGKAEERFGFERHDNVFLFGDAPQDIRAGKEAGVTAVGTATGIYSEEDLREAGADVVLPGLDDTKCVMEIVFD